MPSAPDFVAAIEHLAQRYITILREHPSRTYDYSARGYRGYPVFEIEQHGPKCCRGESWLYIAVPEPTDLRALEAEDRLYVGSQTQDRMFRGDGMEGNNFHHAEMRAGRNGDTPRAFLASGRQIVIWRVPAEEIAARVASDKSLAHLRVLLSQSITAKKHLGWWFEQYLLHIHKDLWRWNSQGAESVVARLFAAEAGLS